MFWERFKSLCDRYSVKPGTVAKNLGLSNSTCTDWKNNGNIPKGDILLKVADYFNVSVDYLLGRDEESPRDEYSEALNEAINLFSNLSEDNQKQALSYLEFLQKK